MPVISDDKLYRTTDLTDVPVILRRARYNGAIRSPILPARAQQFRQAKEPPPLSLSLSLSLSLFQILRAN